MLFITVQPDGSITETTVEDGQPTYPVLKDAVQGWIETGYYGADDFEHYHNEEFLYAEGEVFDQINFVPAYFGFHSRVYGPVIYTGGVDDEGETRGLTDERAAQIRHFAEYVRDNLATLRETNPALPKPEPVVQVLPW